MAIKESKPPRECDKIVHSALQSIWEQSELAKQRFRGVLWEEMSLSAPHQIYLAEAEDIAAGDVLASARLEGWRYIVLANERPLAAAEITVHRSHGKEKFEFSNFDYGPFVENTVEAVRHAVGSLERSTIDYELRVLLIPALYVFTLWFHNREDLLVPVPPTHPALTPFTIYDEERFAESLYEAAEKQLSFNPESLLDPEL